MNESEYLYNMETVETSVFEDSSESDLASVTEISGICFDGSAPYTEVIETSETCYGTTVSDYNHLLVLENNTSGILMMSTGIFFLLLIALIAKIFGGYLSM